MKKFVLPMILIAASFGMAACSDDDDNGGNVYSLSYNSNGVESNDGQLQVWIE